MHYDSYVKRRIRLVLGGGTLFTGLIALRLPASQFPVTLEFPTTVEGLGLVLSIAILIYAVWHIAHLRRESLKCHVLKTNTERLLNEESAEAAIDAVHLADYLKVFFVLALVFHLPEVALLAFPETTALYRLRFTTGVIRTYYLLLFLDFAILLGGRWARTHITNDQDTTPTTTDDTSGT